MKTFLKNTTMEFRSHFLGGIKMEAISAESDCAFFGTGTGSSIHPGFGLNTVVTTGSFSESSSASSSSIESCREPDLELDFRDDLLESLLPDNSIPDLDFDFPDLSSDITLPLMDEDDNLNFMREDSNSNSAYSPSSESNYHDHQSVVDSPPLTPPSPIVKLEPDYQSNFSNCAVSPNLVFVNDAASVTKVAILPALKSSRGRSASHDSPDVQAMKRQIRMIRNRESASLSRKKKKDYVTGLESKISELEFENCKLKQENQVLKIRLSQYQNPQNSKATRNVPGRSKATIAKVALLSVCCFMFVGFRNPIWAPADLNDASHMPNSLSDSNSFKSLTPESHVVPEIAYQKHVRARRSLRWNVEDVNNNSLEKNNNTRILNSNKNATSKFASSSNQSIPLHDETQHSFGNASFKNTPTSRCNMYFNETESLKVQNDLKGIFGPKRPRRKVPPTPKPIVYSLIDMSNEDKGLTLYDEKMRRYSRVLEQLQRREDTYYVVSLTAENQLLLAAKASNSSSRPKMTFLMPWKNDTLGKEEMMQIDCEVTKVLNLNSKKGKKA